MYCHTSQTSFHARSLINRGGINHVYKFIQKFKKNMHVISLSKLKQFWQKHPNSAAGLQYWYKLTTVHKWQSFNEVRQTFPSADLVGNFLVFNICGNDYRLITYIDFKFSKVFIRDVLTHAEYDKENWKKDTWYEN